MPLGLCRGLVSVIATEETKNVTTNTESLFLLLDIARPLRGVSIRSSFLFPMLVKYEMVGI